MCGIKSKNSRDYKMLIYIKSCIYFVPFSETGTYWDRGGGRGVGAGAWLQGTFNTCKFFFDFWSFRKFQFYSGESSSFVVWL